MTRALAMHAVPGLSALRSGVSAPVALRALGSVTVGCLAILAGLDSVQSGQDGVGWVHGSLVWWLYFQGVQPGQDLVGVILWSLLHGPQLKFLGFQDLLEEGLKHWVLAG